MFSLFFQNLFFKIWRMETLFWPCQSRASNVFKQWRFYLTDLIHVSFLHKYGVVLTLPKEQKWLQTQCEIHTILIFLSFQKFLLGMSLLSNLDGGKDNSFKDTQNGLLICLTLLSLYSLNNLIDRSQTKFTRGGGR